MSLANSTFHIACLSWPLCSLDWHNRISTEIKNLSCSHMTYQNCTLESHCFRRVDIVCNLFVSWYMCWRKFLFSWNMQSLSCLMNCFPHCENWATIAWRTSHTWIWKLILFCRSFSTTDNCLKNIPSVLLCNLHFLDGSDYFKSLPLLLANVIMAAPCSAFISIKRKKRTL